jgi:hypothetical protein
LSLLPVCGTDRERDEDRMSQRQSVQLAGVPNVGIVAMWPFAYYAVSNTIRHVDLTSGLLDTMADVGPEAAAEAVVNG